MYSFGAVIVGGRTCKGAVRVVTLGVDVLWTPQLRYLRISVTFLFFLGIEAPVVMYFRTSCKSPHDCWISIQDVGVANGTLLSPDSISSTLILPTLAVLVCCTY